MARGRWGELRAASKMTNDPHDYMNLVAGLCKCGGGPSGGCGAGGPGVRASGTAGARGMGRGGPEGARGRRRGWRKPAGGEAARSGRKHRRPNGYGYMHGTDVLNVSTELADAAWVSVQTTGTVGRGCRPDRSGRASNAGEIGPAGATERQAGVASGSVG